MPTMPVLCLLCLYYACTMPTMPVLCLLCLYYAYYACTMPTMPVLCLLCLYYAYYACTMPTMPVLCLLCLYYAYYACTMPIYNYPKTIAQPCHKTKLKTFLENQDFQRVTFSYFRLQNAMYKPFFGDQVFGNHR